MDVKRHPRWHRQVELEKAMRGIGFARIGGEAATAEFAVRPDVERSLVASGFARQGGKGSVDAAKEKGRESMNPGSQYVLRRVIVPMADAIKAFVNEAYSGKAGRRMTAARLVHPDRIAPETVAYLAVKTALDTISQGLMVQDVAIRIGRAIEEEQRFAFYNTENPALVGVILADHKKRGITIRHTKRVLVNRLERAGVKWMLWPKNDCLHIGEKLVELAIATTGLFTLEQLWVGNQRPRSRKKWKEPYRLMLTPEASDTFNKREQFTALLDPAYLPCVVPPRPWSSVFEGAYWTGILDNRSLRFVKTRNEKYLYDLSAVNMPLVYKAVNAIQATAWKINRKVFDVLGDVWDRQLEISGLPVRRDVAIPTKPLATPPETDDKIIRKEWNESPDGKAWKKWKKEVSEAKLRNFKLGSQRLQVSKTLWVAKMFEQETAMYFPHQLDFRSRVYPMPMYLTPQGPDYARGLLMFADSKPISDETAANWLAIHGANCYGYDKASFSERVKWVKLHSADIVAVAQDPFRFKLWQDADKPWQFLAFCFEWAGFMMEGYGYMSSLPVSLDGTCNGLQHFSAMLRDEVGGAAVNLLPAEKPQDIYQTVADLVIEKLHTKSQEWEREKMRHYTPGQPSLNWPALWLQFGIDRKVTKRAVMVLPYGGTFRACRNYVWLHVDKLVQDGKKDNLFGEQLKPATMYLARVIWHSIGDVVSSAREAMRWLRKIARLVSMQNLPITWVTPVGFPVRQAYPTFKDRMVRLTLSEGITYLRRIREEDDEKLDAAEQINGLSPNFVHSLDASALMACVSYCHGLGIRHFNMVHDSYGTLAADTQQLTRALKMMFVRLYQDHDVLVQLREVLNTCLVGIKKIPPVPEKGSLNIEEVLRSDYFFA